MSASPPRRETGLDASQASDRATAAIVLSRQSARLPSGATHQLESLARSDDSAVVRSAALSALVRKAHHSRAQRVWAVSAADADASVRVTAARLAPHLKGAAPIDSLIELARDDDAFVAEAACFALGELPANDDATATRVLHVLQHACAHHTDPLARESAVAALGSLGDERAVDTILAACHDKPAVRRRAVLALAAFEGPNVDAAIATALTDSDWQVRQAAEDLSVIDDGDDGAATQC
jgi:HEAT repeat protein